MSALFSLLARFYAAAHKMGGVGLLDMRDAHMMSEAQVRFFDDLSHELQTPLAILKGNWEVLAGRREGDRAVALASIGATTDRMGRMIDGFLRSARLELPEAMRRVSLSLPELLEEIHDDCAALADSAGVHFTWASDEGAVMADRDKIKEVILNLISNALKHTDAGGAITVAAKTVGQSGAEIIVRDTGSGIPPDELPHIFERFYRIRNDGTHGMGLGLHICQKIVQAHGGTIQVQSKPDEGTRFVVFLP